MYLQSYFSWHIDVFGGLIESNQNLVKIQYQSSKDSSKTEYYKTLDRLVDRKLLSIKSFETKNVYMFCIRQSKLSVN